MEIRRLEVSEKFVSLSLSGSLDMHSIARVETQFFVLTVGAAKNALVDLSELTFISSLGIGMLVSATKGLRRVGANLVLYSPTTNIAEVLTRAGLKDYLVIVPDADEAQRLISQPR